MKMLEFLKKLWHYSPAQFVNSLKWRLFEHSEWDYSLGQVLQSKKHMNAQYLIDRWERYWRVIENKHGIGIKHHFGFQKNTILELGCGPLFGWGPIAIFLGAEKYFYHEPELLRDVIYSDQVRRGYFYPLFEELVANFGNRMSFAKYYEKVINKCQPGDFSDQASADLILSNSVLEHIPKSEMQFLLDKLFFVTKPGGHYFHSVDFGSHGIGGGGFGSIYAKDQAIDIRRINLLRKSEIEWMLKESGFRSIHTTIYRANDIARQAVHESWIEYSDDDLSARVVFFVGKKAE